MGLEISDDEIVREINALAAATGRSATQAVAAAVREALGRLAPAHISQVSTKTDQTRDFARDVADVLQTLAALHALHGVTAWNDAAAADAAFYDDQGLPR